MSLYLRAPGTARVKIHPYPKRRRVSYVDTIGLSPQLQTRAERHDLTNLFPETPCYQDFFRMPEAVEQAS